MGRQVTLPLHQPRVVADTPGQRPNEHRAEHDPRPIQSDELLWQKVEYIHNNPLRRRYVNDPLHWRYSSARTYAGLPGVVDVVTQR